MTATPVEPTPDDLPDEPIEIGTTEEPDVDPEEVDH